MTGSDWIALALLAIGVVLIVPSTRTRVVHVFHRTDPEPQPAPSGLVADAGATSGCGCG